MKRSVIIIVITFICTMLSVRALAHSGGTDSDGGHNSTSGYHYHHGYPAHSHSGGVCPYDFDDNTDHNSSNTSGSIDNDSNHIIDKESSDDSAFDTSKPSKSDTESAPLETVNSGSSKGTDSPSDSAIIMFLEVMFMIALSIGILILAGVIPETVLNFIFFIIFKVPEDSEDKIPLHLTYSKEVYSQNNFGIRKQAEQIKQYEDYLSFVSDD